MGLVVAVGGGKSKAEAALAVLSTQRQDIYITDEGAAREMLRCLQKRGNCRVSQSQLKEEWLEMAIRVGINGFGRIRPRRSSHCILDEETSSLSRSTT